MTLTSNNVNIYSIRGSGCLVSNVIDSVWHDELCDLCVQSDVFWEETVLESGCPGIHCFSVLLSLPVGRRMNRLCPGCDGLH